MLESFEERIIERLLFLVKALILNRTRHRGVEITLILTKFDSLIWMLLDQVWLLHDSIAHPDITLQALRHGTLSLMSHSHLILFLDPHLQSIMRHLSLVVDSMSCEMAWHSIPVCHLPTPHLVYIIIHLTELRCLGELSCIFTSDKIIEVLHK